MKKRLFAGALALLMIIGLLPVSSMLKKPVETQAAEQTLTHTLSASTESTGTTLEANNYIGSDGFFCVGSDAISITTKKINNANVNVYNYKNGREIKFSVKTTANIVMDWTSGKPNRYMILKKVTDNGTEDIWNGAEDGKTANVLHTSNITIESGSYILTNNNQTYLQDLKVVTTGNTITINDEKANGTTAPKTIVTSYSDGASVNLSAKGTDLLYWKNSNGVIVATGDKGIPVYYSDTYTAVYAKTGAKVEYLTPYGGVLATYYADDEITEPGGPTRYGYTFDGWDTDVETVKTSLADGKDVTVKPKYKDNTDLQHKITIDTTELGGLQSTNSYTVNTEVKASTTSDDFAYWADGDNNVLSYNSTYYFLANRDITVKAVKKSDSDTNANAKPIITKVKYDTATKTIIFEYTVPEEYTINFAGVLASTNETNLNNAKVDNNAEGVYKLGTSECAGYKTVRYTLKNAGIDTWYVKPILTYKKATETNTTETNTIYGDVVTMN